MFDFHTDKKRYFEIQQENAEEYVIPFITNPEQWCLQNIYMAILYKIRKELQEERHQ